MFPPALRASLRAVMAALLLAAGIAGAQTVPSSPIGKPVILEGTLDVLVEDFADGQSRLRHFLETARGRVELKFAGTPTQLPSGTRVRVHGQTQGSALALLDGSPGSIVPLATVLPNTMGQQSIAVILVNFQDDTSQPTTIADAQRLVFDDVNKHYKESSFGQTWFVGEVFGWYTIAMSKATCDPPRLASLAEEQVGQSVDLANFQRRVYVFPRNACAFESLGKIGGTEAWVNGDMTLQAVGHVLGHNYGLAEANAYDCDTGVWGDTCREVVGGDAADLMGKGRPGQFNPFEKEQLGWLNDGISPPITTVTTSGRHAIEPYSAGTVGPKALKIRTGRTDRYGREVLYYVEYRQPIGGDSALANTGNLTEGVVVRYAVEYDRESSYQLDMSPGTSTNSFDEMADGALAVGQSYVESFSGITLTLVSTSSTGAMIDVQITPPCKRAAPTISLSGGGTAVLAGTNVGYTLKVTNRDSGTCEATTFSLGRSVPTGWAGTLGTTSMTLSPGATGTTLLNVTSAQTAAAESYGIGAATSSPVGALHTASASAIYLVAAPPTTLSIADASIVEGNAGTAMAKFTVSLSQPAATSVTFDVATKNGTAMAGSDYTATSITHVTIPPGGTSATVSAPVVGDTATEGNETFQVVVTNVLGATVSDGFATGTIRNDDTTLSIGDVSVLEGNAGSRSATFTVKLTNFSASPVSFNIATANGTAAAGSDYAALALVGQSIPAGSTSKTFTVSISGDLIVEGNETLLVNVSGVKGAVVADAQAVGTIRNDDTVLRIADASIAEGNSGTKTLSFTVKLSAVSAAPVTFDIATAGKTALAGLDYVALVLAGQSIPAGTTGKVFNVAIKGDTVREGNETFALNVGSVVGAAVGDAQAIGTIVNDD